MKYKVAIDLNNENEEKTQLIESQEFDTYEEADNWYRSLTFCADNVDVIIIFLENGQIVDTNLIA